MPDLGTTTSDWQKDQNLPDESPSHFKRTSFVSFFIKKKKKLFYGLSNFFDPLFHEGAEPL